MSFKPQKSGLLYNYLRCTYHLARSFPRFFRGPRRHCPICDYNGTFLSFGYPPRYDALCPYCGGLERHRLLRLWLERSPGVLVGKRVLHFAPEAAVTAFLRHQTAAYKSADLKEGQADIVLNIEALDVPDSSHDVVVCSHVLEHVDDRRALAELYRILAPGGLAILMFPMIEAWGTTLEEALLPVPVKNAADRTLYFGQHDHVRFYGRDVRKRIAAAGFSLSEFAACEPDVSHHGLQRGETIFLARKPP